VSIWKWAVRIAHAANAGTPTAVLANELVAATSAIVANHGRCAILNTRDDCPGALSCTSKATLPHEEAAAKALADAGDVALGRSVVDLLIGESDAIEVEAVHHQLEKLVEGHPGKTVVLNLARVKAVSSELIGSVLMLQRQARAKAGGLRLCDLDERVLHVFKLSRVDANLDIQPDVEAALGGET